MFIIKGQDQFRFEYYPYQSNPQLRSIFAKLYYHFNFLLFELSAPLIFLVSWTFNLTSALLPWSHNGNKTFAQGTKDEVDRSTEAPSPSPRQRLGTKLYMRKFHGNFLRKILPDRKNVRIRFRPSGIPWGVNSRSNLRISIRLGSRLWNDKRSNKRTNVQTNKRTNKQTNQHYCFCPDFSTVRTHLLTQLGIHL